MNFGPELSTYKGKTIGYFGTKALPFHMGHVAMILEAAQYVDVLFVVIGYDDEWDKKMCERTNFEWVPHTIRERWVTQTLKDIPNVRVLSNYERRSDEYLNDPEVLKANVLLEEKIQNKIDIVFSSELNYEKYFNYVLPHATHHILDSGRKTIPISATKIREVGVYGTWNFLPKPVQMYYVKRIALCGVESVGKTTSAKLLASFYNTIFVEEYGRTYYELLGGYHEIDMPSDFLEIIAGHVHSINKALPMANRILLIDTDAIYTEYFLEGKEFKRNVNLQPFIMQEMEKIDLRIYIPPVNEHHLDGTRRPVSEVERFTNHQRLLNKYLYYRDTIGFDFVQINPQKRSDIFSLLKTVVGKYLGV